MLWSSSIKVICCPVRVANLCRGARLGYVGLRDAGRLDLDAGARVCRVWSFWHGQLGVCRVSDRNAPGMSIVCWCLAARELFAGGVSLLGMALEMGVWRWLSRRGGELPVALFSRSSASRNLLCRASSSCACVLTACFLTCC